MWHDDEAPAGARDLADLPLLGHRSGADQRLTAEALDEPPNANDRRRRIERYLDDDEAAFDEGRADRLDLVRTHAAQDRDERAALQPIPQIRHGLHLAAGARPIETSRARRCRRRACGRRIRAWLAPRDKA